jgi:hypothetical protein
MIATCLRLTFDGIVRGSSGHRMIKSRLSMAVMIAGHQPNDSSGYFAMTYEPTRSVSQGLGGAAVAFSALPVDAAMGVAALEVRTNHYAVRIVPPTEICAVADLSK